MLEVCSVLSVVESFAMQLQAIGIMKEYVWSYKETDDGNKLEFEFICAKFVEELNIILKPHEKNVAVPEIPLLKKIDVQLQVDENEIAKSMRANGIVLRKRKDIDEDIEELNSRSDIDDPCPVTKIKVEHNSDSEISCSSNQVEQIDYDSDASVENHCKHQAAILDIEERLKVIEAHLNLNTGKNTNVATQRSDSNSLSTQENSDFSSAGSNSSLLYPDLCGEEFSALSKMKYNEFPQRLLKLLQNGEQPSPGERREIVRILVDQIPESIPKPRGKHLKVVARGMVEKYPFSFREVVGNKVIGSGYITLLRQLIYRKENRRRSKREKFTTKKLNSKINSSIKLKSLDYPDGENELRQKVKQKFLQEEFIKENPDEKVIETFMSSTYVSQRFAIENEASLKKIFQDWPFLIRRKHFFKHAEQLLGFSLSERYAKAITDTLPDVFGYFEMKIIDLDIEAFPGKLNYIIFLSSYFKEDSDRIFQVYKKNQDLDELAKKVPKTPFIACIGDPYNLEPVCTVFVKQIPLETMIPLDDALHMWFGSFHVFKLPYPKECCATLEFIQRTVYDINPYVDQSKKSLVKRAPVLNLLKRISDFKNKCPIPRLDPRLA